jgi:hypothetical protein
MHAGVSHANEHLSSPNLEVALIDHPREKPEVCQEGLLMATRMIEA